jgi:hypothetical protein
MYWRQELRTPTRRMAPVSADDVILLCSPAPETGVEWVEPTSHRPCQIHARCSGDQRGTAGSHGDTDRHSPIQPLAGHRRSEAISAGVAGQGFEPWTASADGFTGRVRRRLTSTYIYPSWRPSTSSLQCTLAAGGGGMPDAVPARGGSACDDTPIPTSPRAEEGPRSRTRGGGSFKSRFISHADT